MMAVAVAQLEGLPPVPTQSDPSMEQSSSRKIATNGRIVVSQPATRPSSTRPSSSSSSVVSTSSSARSTRSSVSKGITYVTQDLRTPSQKPTPVTSQGLSQQTTTVEPSTALTTTKKTIASISEPEQPPTENALAVIGSSHAKVQTSLETIGARPLRDYVDQLRLVRQRQDDEHRVAERREQQRRRGMPVHFGSDSDSPTDEMPSSASQAGSTSTSTRLDTMTDPLFLLPFQPSSRLGKKLLNSSTGDIRDVFTVYKGRSYVSQLNEFLQGMGCDLAEYDTSNQYRSRLKTSPDFFVSVVVHTFCFVDNVGKPNTKAGKECVAKMALMHFFPETYWRNG